MKKLPGCRFVGLATPNNRGGQAAILQNPVARDVIEAAYALLPSGARMNIMLAKRWKVWGVLATEDWCLLHARRLNAPKGREVEA